jgi:hypothetical protein
MPKRYPALPKAVPKLTVDARTAALLGMDRKEVAVITAAFLQEAVNALASEGALNLNGLGEFHVTSIVVKRSNILMCNQGGRAELREVLLVRKDKVYFRKSWALYRAIINERGKPRSKIRKLQSKAMRDRYRHK